MEAEGEKREEEEEEEEEEVRQIQELVNMQFIVQQA